MGSMETRTYRNKEKEVKVTVGEQLEKSLF